MANNVYTFEELLTLVTFVEFIINSRPLCKMTEDVNDFHYLSPAHFLVGRSLTTLPLPDFQDIPIGRLDRFQKLQNECSNLCLLVERLSHVFAKIVQVEDTLPIT